MHMDPFLPVLVGAAFVVLLIGPVLLRLRQPHAVI